MLKVSGTLNIAARLLDENCQKLLAESLINIDLGVLGIC